MCLFLQLGKIFRSPGIFLERKSGKMKRFFQLFKKRSTCTKFFMLWKLWEKSSGVFSLLVGYLILISTHFWNFPTSGSRDISGFPESRYFSGVYPPNLKTNFFGSFCPIQGLKIDLFQWWWFFFTNHLLGTKGTKKNNFQVWRGTPHWNTYFPENR